MFIIKNMTVKEVTTVIIVITGFSITDKDDINITAARIAAVIFRKSIL